jgi:glyoxylase-like metal-dependent hydrolase (beta-lactamase superfamily II)
VPATFLFPRALHPSRLRDFGIAARVLTTPGHTAGSLSILADNGDCVTGDFLASLYTREPDLVAGILKELADGEAKCFYPPPLTLHVWMPPRCLTGFRPQNEAFSVLLC